MTGRRITAPKPERVRRDVAGFGPVDAKQAADDDRHETEDVPGAVLWFATLAGDHVVAVDLIVPPVD